MEIDVTKGKGHKEIRIVGIVEKWLSNLPRACRLWNFHRAPEREPESGQTYFKYMSSLLISHDRGRNVKCIYRLF